VVPEPDINRSLKTCLLVLMTACMLQTGCMTRPAQNDPQSGGSSLGYLAKSDIDTVSDLHARESLALVRELAEKLYRRNPSHCKHTGRTIEECLARISNHNDRLPELGGKRSIDALQLTFEDSYHGDRVLAFIVGMQTMMLASYNNKTDFYLMDELDPQKLYNSARNVEIAVWRLSNKHDQNGQLYLLSNSRQDEVPNLSYERLFGKLIANQDMMSRIIAEKFDRRVKNIIQSLATAVFLPI
jgi:hypothetical protein